MRWLVYFLVLGLTVALTVAYPFLFEVALGWALGGIFWAVRPAPAEAEDAAPREGDSGA